ncbi:MAG: DUF2163 domain-containing protein [Paracoccaceae bacterium]
MSGIPENLQAHLKSGLTTLCRCWSIRRKDGVVLGFTDHDNPLTIKGQVFKADSGLSASALAQSTGLSVDNAEALGALSDAAISEADIEAGRFDGAEVSCWLVNWQDVEARWLQFQGSLGELRRAGGAFTAELRGLTDQLNRPFGRVYQKPCTAVVGDGQCRVDLDQPGFRFQTAVDGTADARVFTWTELPGFTPDWFARGRLDVVDGAATGLWAAIKSDKILPQGRVIELWEPLRAPITPGDTIRLTAGCDKRLTTCGAKFNNTMNFQGFPDIPGEDWMMVVPKKAGANTGGSRR